MNPYPRVTLQCLDQLYFISKRRVVIYGDNMSQSDIIRLLTLSAHPRLFADAKAASLLVFSLSSRTLYDHLNPFNSCLTQSPEYTLKGVTTTPVPEPAPTRTNIAPSIMTLTATAPPEAGPAGLLSRPRIITLLSSLLVSLSSGTNYVCLH